MDNRSSELKNGIILREWVWVRHQIIVIYLLIYEHHRINDSNEKVRDLKYN